MHIFHKFNFRFVCICKTAKFLWGTQKHWHVHTLLSSVRLLACVLTRRGSSAQPWGPSRARWDSRRRWTLFPVTSCWTPPPSRGGAPPRSKPRPQPSCSAPPSGHTASLDTLETEPPVNQTDTALLHTASKVSWQQIKWSHSHLTVHLPDCQ